MRGNSCRGLREEESIMGYYTKRELNELRKEMPCKFNEGITYYEFEQIANNVAKQFSRIKEVTVGNGVIICKVESLTGYSDWYFSVDFNNWGHIQGRYWWHTDNNDSNICEAYGDQVQKELRQLRGDKNLLFPDFQKLFNDEVTISHDLSYVVEEPFWERLFAKRRQITFWDNTTKLTGEHICCVIALLKSKGFKNITTCSQKDVGKESNHYIYEVDHITIDDETRIRKGAKLPSNSEIIIYYHDKQKIKMPYSAKHYRRKNYVTVGDEFLDLGFSKIYERKIEDLITGWIKKDGSVEDVFVEIDNEEIQIKKGQQYEFDTPIIIEYHTYKYL